MLALVVLCCEGYSMKKCRSTCLCSSDYKTIVCANNNLTSIPSIEEFSVKITKSTVNLGLQRNDISSIDAQDLQERFPHLVLLDVREQLSSSVVNVENGPLPDKIRIYGEFLYIHTILELEV